MDIKEVLNSNIFKVWARFILASVVGVVLNTIYTVVDGIFIGQGVGEVGLAGVNIAWPAVTLIVGIGLMIGIGTSSIMAIYMGKGKNKKAEKALGTCISLIIIVGIIITILGLVFREPIIKMLGATPDTIKSAIDYYTIIFIIAIPYMFATALNPIVRTDGRPDLSMIMIGIGAVANIILDWLFVMKLGFGVKGAAIATSASIVISMTVSFYYFIMGKANIKIKRKHLKIDKGIVKRILNIGFVSFAIQISYGIILLTQNKTMFLYGSTIDVAIYTVATYVNCFLVNTCMGIAQGLQPLIGYHYGAKKIRRMNQFVYITIAVCILGGVLVYSGIFVYGREIIRIFGVDSKNIEFAYKMILIYCIGSPIIGIIFTMSGYYQAIGKNIYANIISIGRGFVFQFIFTIVLPHFIGTTGVFLSLPLAELITFIILGVIVLIESRKNSRNLLKNKSVLINIP
ncbi:MATE family efflux transporter [Clostridium sp. 1001271B_151109_B4]|uniref:MATE family efflux transporter n=1 Tax=Clostridium sp. 1001271B_151109_B4 TaxID=2787148 RepID=UPI0018A9BF4B